MGGMCCVCAAQSPISLNTVVTCGSFPSPQLNLIRCIKQQSVRVIIFRGVDRVLVDANAARFSYDGVFLHGAVGI